MPRRFYLPPHRPVRTASKPKLSLGMLPLWVKVAVPATLVLAMAIIGLDALGIWPRSAAPGTRYQAGSALPADTTNQPADTGMRPRDVSEVVAEPVAVLPQPTGPIRLQVLNGCGVRGLAKLVSPALRAKGFDVRETRNAGSFSYTHTLIMDRVGRPELAQAVADSLGIDRSLVRSETGRNLEDIDVTVIVGADYESLRLDLKR